MSSRLETARQLITLRKFGKAIKELDLSLAEYPDNDQAYAFKALALMAMERPVEALQNAQKAVTLDPEYPHNFYILSAIHFHATNDYRQAEIVIEQALRLDAEDADYYDRYAQIKLAMNQYQSALELAERGLAIDPENVDLKRTKASIQAWLGKGSEAAESIAGVLSDDPEEETSFSTAGWIHLMNGNPQKADVSFREALRLNPNHETARTGLAQSLKARNFLFRQYLKYVFWLNRLGSFARIMVIVGAAAVMQLIRLVPELTPIVAVYGVFAISTWLIDPVYNLFLRFDRFGRYALTRAEIITSDLVSGLLLLAVGAAVTSAFINNNSLVMASFALFAFILPVSSIAGIKADRPKRYRLFLSAVIILGLFLLVGLLQTSGDTDVANFCFTVTIAGSVLAAWLVTILKKN